MFKLCQIALLLIISFFCGCLGLSSGDPDRKLEQAVYLFDQQLRPLPAEKLIQEAIAKYQTDQDELGLAEAFRIYGFFFGSVAIEQWEYVYNKHGFIDTAATYDNRLDKSIEYYVMAAKLFEKYQRNDEASNVYLNLALAYERMNDVHMACASYQKSLDFHNKFTLSNTDNLVVLPDGYESYEAFINERMSGCGCDKGGGRLGPRHKNSLLKNKSHFLLP